MSSDPTKQKGCCKAHRLLQSTRGAANHMECCKAQGVLQSTRGAARHTGCFLYIIYIHMFVCFFCLFVRLFVSLFVCLFVCGINLGWSCSQFQPIYNLHSGQFCQVFQLMMPEYCDENNFSTGSDRAAKIFKAAVCFGQLRLIYIYIYTF